MTEPELAVMTAAGGGFAWILKWAVALWAEVRREGIAADKETAAAAKETSATMVSALLAQAKSNEQLAAEHAKSTVMLSGKIDTLLVKLDTIVDWRDRTPVEGVPITRDPIIRDSDSERDVRRRLRTVPQGNRVVKPIIDEDK